MRNSIATYKESLSRITSDVLDAAEELEVPGSRSGHDSPVPNRRFSRRLSQSVSSTGSPVPNGIDSGSRSEIEQHREEIERLQTSEAEIKALAINYAAILKEKEGQLSRLHEENSSLRKSLEARDENLKVTKNNSVTYKGASNQSPSRQHRHGIQKSPRSSGNNAQSSVVSKQDTLSNGGALIQSEGILQKSDQKLANLSGNKKELEVLLEENNKALAALRNNHQSELKQLIELLENERGTSANFRQKFQDECELNESFKKELHQMKMVNEKTTVEMKELLKKLDVKISETRQLQEELNRKNAKENLDEHLKHLKTMIATLEKENTKLQMEKDRLVAAMEHVGKNTPGKGDADDSKFPNKASGNLDQEKEEMALSIQQLEKTLKDTFKDRDRAQRELARLKQHLLDKELEESDKMDEDSKIIEELRARCEYQKTQILKLEKALKLEMAKQEEIRNAQRDELQRSNDIINGLKQKLANSMSLVDSKNVELLNLQTALGQYYAESEAKERLERDLAAEKEQSAKLSELLKVAKRDLEISSKDNEEIVSNLLQAERMLSESKRTVQKLQEDNSKLHRAVEQSMTRINRMSVDSDYYVDRRIVLKLLVTYFQRNHSKEVLGLMVRMLGFSEEDKRRIGFAQQTAGKTVVRGVLGLPGRLVGGILGGKSPETSSEIPSENQSFTDLWVDFLLKDAEQRERRESAEVENSSSSVQQNVSNTAGAVSSLGTSIPSSASFPSVHSYTNHFSSPFPKQARLSDSDAEFANVPLTSSVSPATENSSRYSRLLPKY